MDLRAAIGHSRTAANFMNFIQKIRASHLNRHGFIDVTVGAVFSQIILSVWVVHFSNFDPTPTFEGATAAELRKVYFFMFSALVLAPYFENLLLVWLSALHEKLFKRRMLFVISPAILTALHFTPSQPLDMPAPLRFVTVFALFFIFLKQYDLHKLEMGLHKALLLTSAIHFLANAAGILTQLAFESNIDAGTIFSAQPGE